MADERLAGAELGASVSRIHPLQLGQDFLYPNANHNLTFLDNHDMTRFLTAVGGDVNKFKMGLAFLLTTRGIPQLYYGDEILMAGDGLSHPEVRKDFPGGWPGDPRNAFTAAGRTEAQGMAFDYLKKLLNWRQTKAVVHQGKPCIAFRKITSTCISGTMKKKV